MKSITIALDDYEEIFSDFDVRDYVVRELSKDFLEELYRRVYEDGCSKKLKVVLTLPSYKRNKRVEKVISDRLRKEFVKKYNSFRLKVRNKMLIGFAFVLFGVFLLFVSLALPNDGEFFLYFFKEFLFLPSWFFTWRGLDELLYFFDKKDRLMLYDCLRKASFSFDSEENIV